MASDYVNSGQERMDQEAAANMNKRVKAHENSEIRTSAAGLGSLAKKINSRKAMPKQSDFGGDMKAFGAAMRKYREEMDSDPETVAQRKVLSK